MSTKVFLKLKNTSNKWKYEWMRAMFKHPNDIVPVYRDDEAGKFSGCFRYICTSVNENRFYKQGVEFSICNPEVEETTFSRNKITKFLSIGANNAA
jgi:hypothetical protein